MEVILGYIPQWLREWFSIYLTPLIKIEGRKLLLFLGKGVTDALLFFGLPLTLSFGSQQVWNARYNLTPTQQAQVAQWAGAASLIAYIEDVPPVAPLVLWYKESGLQAQNPANCEGIMGFYTAVSTGEMPCFPPGPIGAEDIAYQLRLGARIFKEYCPEAHFNTTDPKILKRCYLYYNAGPRSQMDPNQSAYVMNGYDALHQNMPHTDITGRTTRLTALGAWPVHLAIQAQMARSNNAPLPAALLAPAMLLQEGYDRLWAAVEHASLPTAAEAPLARCGAARTNECLVSPHIEGDVSLRPALSPVIAPLVGGNDITCGALPGIDLITAQATLIVAPAPGMLTQYTDVWGNLSIQIENEEWSVWLTGLRSYVKGPGAVTAGQPIGAIGGVNNAMPAIHYAIYDKINTGYVDPVNFLPSGTCPSVN